jgi:glycosyltransferase involved in cell wall biosynthesis
VVTLQYHLSPQTVEVIPHAGFDHHQRPPRRQTSAGRECSLLYLGVIRPFKGVEDLVRAFDSIPPQEIDGYRLTIAGETWEGHFLPSRLIASSRYRDRITFINRYLSDDEVGRLFANADVVVLPYRRSFQSGPLHIAMHYGLPVVVTSVGGLVESVDGYAGVTLAEPRAPSSLLTAIRQARERAGQRFVAPHSWADTAHRYWELFEKLEGPPKLQLGEQLVLQ